MERVATAHCSLVEFIVNVYALIDERSSRVRAGMQIVEGVNWTTNILSCRFVSSRNSQIKASAASMQS